VRHLADRLIGGFRCAYSRRGRGGRCSEAG
jgi:hypothetical protein